VAQINTGLRGILKNALVYDLFERIVGSKKYFQLVKDRYLNLNKGARILDLGCGTAKILEFLDEDTEYFGFDLSQEYINSCKEKFSDKGTFVCCPIEEVFNQIEEGTFDRVVSTGVIHHLDNDQAITLFKIAKKALKPNCWFTSADPVFIENQNAIAKYIISKDRGTDVRTSERYKVLAEQVFSEVETIVTDDLLNIPYNHCILKCS